MKYFLAIVLCLSFFGCASTPQIQKPFVDPQYGMSKLELTQLLGKPESIEIFKRSDESRIEFYFYVRKYQSSQDKVPVCLVNNKVVGWGKSYFEDHVSQDEVRIK